MVMPLLWSCICVTMRKSGCGAAGPVAQADDIAPAAITDETRTVFIMAVSTWLTSWRLTEAAPGAARIDLNGPEAW
ncbi:hypothetical protein GCM10007417_23160 [Glycocaulis alkaliphilus]|nr:hypothetical protein GCM10007417_23160 [Glycocaulis alkaliphilus]